MNLSAAHMSFVPAHMNLVAHIKRIYEIGPALKNFEAAHLTYTYISSPHN